MSKRTIIIATLGILLLTGVNGYLYFKRENKVLASSADGKVQVPIEAMLDCNTTLKDRELAIGKEFPIVLSFASGIEAYRVTGKLETKGVVVLVSAPPLVWNSIGVGQTVKTEARFRIVQQGEGEIRWIVQREDSAGRALLGRRSDLYFLATEDDVFTGTVSPWIVKRDYLADSLAQAKSPKMNTKNF